jgi:hypothetical protein
MDPTGYPMIKLLGTKNEVENFRDLIQDEDAIDVRMYIYFQYF